MSDWLNLLDFDDESYASSEDEEEKYKMDEAGEVILDACRDGKLGAVKRLITKENINSIINRETPLIAACSQNRMQVVKFLIEAGADVLKHGKDYKDNYYPLSTACSWGSPALVKFLLDNGADKGVNKSAFGNRPLHEAVWNRKDRDAEIVKMLLKAGAKVDARGSYGKTPLIAAVMAQTSSFLKNPPQAKQIEVLLEAGADPDAYNMEGQCPLLLSLRYPIIFRLLVEYGADVNIVDLYPLDYVDPKCAEILLEYDAGVDIRCGHRTCQYDKLMCSYFKHCVDDDNACAMVFERYFIKMEVAGLYFGKGTSLIGQREYKFFSYKGKKLERFRKKCRDELARISTEKIGDTGATYLDVLYQRKWALLRVEFLTLKTCQAHFPVYGGLIHSRFVTGRSKLPLIDKCMGFFELTELPHLQHISVTKILGYLSVRDLKNVVSAQKPQKKKEDVFSIAAGLLSIRSGPGQSAEGGSTSGGVGPCATVDGGSARSGLKRKASEDGGSTSSMLLDTDNAGRVPGPGPSADGGSTSSGPDRSGPLASGSANIGPKPGPSAEKRDI